MRIEQARAVAADWMGSADFGSVPVVGAFFAGSTLNAAPRDELAAESDVDIFVVVEGAAPPKLGKFRHSGVLLEVTFLSESALADADEVARSWFLAPSFAGDAILTDPHGRLRRIQSAVAPQFARPEVVRARYEGVLARMTAAPAPAGSWPEAVTGWLFPASLATNVLLVAARRNPTVRLRYLRAREVLDAFGHPEVYPELLDQLGCRQVGPEQVRLHLEAMTAAFDAAGECGPVEVFFRSDITAAARPIAVDGTAAMIARGEHREAVFWLVATFSRCLQILELTGAPETDLHLQAFSAAVTDLLGVRSTADLEARRSALGTWLPRLRRTAEQIAASQARPGSAGGVVGPR